jgi:hypothetical protein
MGVLTRLAQIARDEFGDVIVSCRFLGRRASVSTKLRLELRDGTFVDVWINPLHSRYSFHWEQRARRGLIYRHDNAPDHPHIATFPKHFHDGDEHQVAESTISDNPEDALREFLEFVRVKLDEWGC